MPLSTTDILLKHVCPGLGVGIAFVLFSSPLKVCKDTQHLTARMAAADAECVARVCRVTTAMTCRKSSDVY